MNGAAKEKKGGMGRGAPLWLPPSLSQAGRHRRVDFRPSKPYQPLAPLLTSHG